MTGARFRRVALLLCAVAVAGCARLGEVGKAPDFSPPVGNDGRFATADYPMPDTPPSAGSAETASLWSGERKSLFGDRRAGHRGDILTVVIQIDDSAQMSNTSGRTRAGSDKMGIPSLFGIPQRIDRHLPTGATMAEAVSTNSASSYQGSGTIQRNEKLTLRVAATVIEELANGILRLAGTQEVRVNNELRELTVTGYVRPEDITRQNEVTYDKIAGARISYGGRGQITDVQQPRYGQQIADVLLPF